MQEMSIVLEHCYGIKELTYTFSFVQSRTYSVYAPNGFMKTLKVLLYLAFSRRLLSVHNLSCLGATVLSVHNLDDFGIDFTEILTLTKSKFIQSLASKTFNARLTVPLFRLRATAIAVMLISTPSLKEKGQGISNKKEHLVLLVSIL